MKVKHVAILIRTVGGGLRSVLYTIKHKCEMLDDIAVMYKAISKLSEDLKVDEQIVSLTFINESEE